MTVETQALIAAGDARKTELVEMAGGLYALSEGHRQLNGLRQVRSSSTVSLEASGDASYFGPDAESPGAGLAVISSVGVGRTAEEVGNLVVN
jgi:hypothetical protein